MDADYWRSAGGAGGEILTRGNRENRAFWLPNGGVGGRMNGRAAFAEASAAAKALPDKSAGEVDADGRGF